MDVDTDQIKADLRAVFSLEVLLDMVARFAIISMERLAKMHPELKGVDKENLVVELLDGYIQLPGFLDNAPIDADGRMIRGIVKKMVSEFNDMKGHDWSEKVV